MIAVDSNILIYAHRTETDSHRAAVAELVRLAEGPEPWALPVFCIPEFLRVVTHRRVFHPPSTVTQAFGFLRRLLASPSCLVLRPGPRFVELLRETVEQADARGNLIFDAQIAALCREHAVSTVLTRDHDFRRFARLEVRFLEPPPPAR